MENKQLSFFQGVSEVTQKKELDFYGICNTRLMQRKFQPYISRIYMFDVFCGDGHNVVNGDIMTGSPGTIANAIECSGITETKDVFLICSDIRHDAITKLNNYFDNRKWSFGYGAFESTASDQIKHIHKIAKQDKKAHFIIVVDPNGPKALPFDEIEQLSKDKSVRNRVDIIVNVSATSIKRMVKHRISAGAKYDWWIKAVEYLGRDFFQRIAKNYKGAWIRKPLGDKQGWVIMAYFNWSPPKNDWNKAGFIDFNSKQGQQALLSYEVK